MARFYKTKTKYVMNKEPEYEKLSSVDVAKELLPLLKNEAQGDYDLAALMAVRNILHDPKRMCFKARALNSQGQPTETTSVTARKWNVHGAVELVTFGTAPISKRRELLAHIAKCLPREDKGYPLFQYLERWDITHGKVLHLLNMAIASRKLELGYAKKAV